MAQDDEKQLGSTVEGEWRDAELAPATDDADTDFESSERPPRKWAPKIVVLLLLVAIGAGAYFGWQQTQKLLQQQAERNQQQNALSTQIQSLQNALAELRAQSKKQASAQTQHSQSLAQIESIQASTQASNEQAIAALQNTLAEWAARDGTDQAGWQVAEAEWLLWLANMRLQLQQEYNGAQIALEQADALLQQLNDPRLRSVRSAIAEELLAIKTAERPDIDNIALSLLAISNQSAQLPLPARPKPSGEIQQPAEQAEKDGKWSTILAGLWQEIRGLVVIRRQEKNLRPWLSDREEQLIYQGLQVRLDAARLAALRGKGSLYQQSVRSAQTWLLTWFDTGTAAVEAVDAELNALATQRLEPAVPEISGSLTLLRQLRQQGLK